MKKYLNLRNVVKISVTCLAVMTVISCSGNKSKDNGKNAETSTSQTSPDKGKQLPFERGSYVEESDVMGMVMTKTTYFDKWGEWKAVKQVFEMQMMGIDHKTEKLNITKGKEHWDIDLNKKTGTYYQLEYPSNTGMDATVAAAMSGNIPKGMELKDLGEENYLGYTCKKMYVKYPSMDMEVTTLSYGNLSMKMDGRMGKMEIANKITSIDLTTALPDSIFEIPKGVVITKTNDQ